MKKRVCAALLALLLIIGPACPAALADGLPEPEEGVAIEQPLTPEPTNAPVPETGDEPIDGAPTEDPSPEPEPPAEPSQEPEPSTGQETPIPEPSVETPQEPPLVEETPEPAPEPPSNELPPEITPQPPEDDGCNTIEELAELVARDEGGTVIVTGDLVLAEGDHVWLDVQNPVTIDLESYGIVVSRGAKMSLNGSIRVTGTGAPRPLVTVEGDHGLSLREGAELAAEGENAVAVELAGGTLGINSATIGVSGESACAVRLVGELAETYREEFGLNEATLLAEGEGAVCIRSPIPVWLTSCRLESTGTLVEAPALTLDSTHASPVPEDAHVIRRVAVPDVHLYNNGLWIAQGAAQEELDSLLENRLFYHTFRYGLVDVEGVEEPWIVSSEMTWSSDPVDVTTPGVTWFTGTPVEPTLLGVPLPECRVPVVVADPSRPGLMSARVFNNGVRLFYFSAIQGAEEVTLWYSTDKGATWMDAGALPEAEFDVNLAILPQLPEANTDYLFRLEVAGGPMDGLSNVLRYLHYDNGWGNGGDWDGGDWGDQGPLPDDHPEPPPDREPEVGTTPDPEPGGTPTEPDREDGGDQSDPDDEPGSGSKPQERPERPDPPIIPTPSPAPKPPKTEVTFVEPVPTLIPTPTPEETMPPAETPLPVSPTPEATPAPAPTPESPKPAPREEPAPALPEGAAASLTGRDLEAQKLANPAGVTLAGDGLKVTLPYALTDALSLGKDGVLAVRLALLEPNQFEIRFWADGREIADFGGGAFTVSVPVADAEGAEHLCTAQDGTETTASALTDNRAEFELTATGVYTLSIAAPETAPSGIPLPTAPAVTAAPEEPNAQPAPILPIALGAAALAAAGGVLLWRRRGGR